MKHYSFIAILFLATTHSSTFYGWGELGHHLIGKTAAEILPEHPDLKKNPTENTKSFIALFAFKNIQQGHLSNVPDTYWRNLDEGLEEDGNLLGAPAHFFDSEIFMQFANPKDFFKTKIPLDYEQAVAALKKGHFYKEVGSIPWRTQQLLNLYKYALSNPAKDCATETRDNHPSRVATAYSGIMSHYSGDASMPYHASADYDGAAVGHKGIHKYFEEDLVYALEDDGLKLKVKKLAIQLLTENKNAKGLTTVSDLWAKARELYGDLKPEQEAIAVIISLLGDSFQHMETVRQLDYTYGLATLKEALEMTQCKDLPVVQELKTQYEKLETTAQKNAFLKVKVLSQPAGHHEKNVKPACRRHPSTRVDGVGMLDPNGKTVAQWNEELIIQRIALSTALTADLWVKGYLQSGAPKMCHTFKYGHRPSFISPTDPNCFGYALKENPKLFEKKKGGTVLPWKHSATSMDQCLKF